jgi:hypothetical protein
MANAMTWFSSLSVLAFQPFIVAELAEVSGRQIAHFGKLLIFSRPAGSMMVSARRARRA